MPYIDEDFLLKSEQARTLYHEYAAGMPIIDYHCHLPPAEVAADTRWDNLTQVWLNGDHYKWRTMRSNGIDERFCTGEAPDREKFEKFAATMPYLLRNPMHHWSHLELSRYFGIEDVLSPATADSIWDRSLVRLGDPEMSARGLMQSSNVKLVCTTDDPVDSLEHHRAVAADGAFDVQMRPTWRPDKALAIDRVEFFAGAAMLGQDGSAPYTLVWTDPSAGTHSLTARAYDTNQGWGLSETVTVTVTTLGKKMKLGIDFHGL